MGLETFLHFLADRVLESQLGGRHLGSASFHVRTHNVDMIEIGDNHLIENEFVLRLVVDFWLGEEQVRVKLSDLLL